MEKKDYIIDESLYSWDFNAEYKHPVEYLQFLLWVNDLIDITKQLNSSPNKWYVDIFYIRLVGLFDVISGSTSIQKSEDDYTLRVKQCVSQMYNALTDEEYIHLEYSRHIAAHPLQNGYDFFDMNGNKKDKLVHHMIRGEEKTVTYESIIRLNDEVACKYLNNGKSFASDMLNKLTLYILQLQEGLYQRYVDAVKSVNLSPGCQMYETMTKIMTS